jgi:hypothetical protein
MNAFDWMVFCTLKIPLEEDRRIPFWAREMRPLLVKALLLLKVIVIVIVERWLWCALKAFLLIEIFSAEFHNCFWFEIGRIHPQKSFFARVRRTLNTRIKHLYDAYFERVEL